MSDDMVGYFGFGSLVNKHTLRTSYAGMVPARLKGYRRHWQARTDTLAEKVALLSIHKDNACDILGMIVIDHKENLPLVDEREEGYSRHAISYDQVDILGDIRSEIAELNMPSELYVYIADEVHDVPDTGNLLQSYLDAVMQGFRNEFGDEGALHFVKTTKGFDRGLIKDRQSPVYPRSVVLSKDEVELFDLLVNGAIDQISA